MPYRQEQFINNGIYHIVIRGIDNNIIFKDVNDYYRGIFSIYEFNNVKPVTIRERRKLRAQIKKIAKQNNRDPISVDIRDKLVEILSFCFMPNHLHLLLRQLKDNGISKFMTKLGVGYGGYFNRKYGRKGYVFQNRFRAVPIKTDAQLKIIFVYVHTNPTSLIESRWKEGVVKSPNGVIEFLENYKWSSYQDYIGKKNFPSVSDREYIFRVMAEQKKCKQFVEEWVKHKGKIKKYDKLSLE